VAYHRGYLIDLVVDGRTVGY